jgi:shikimate kinase
LTLPRLVFLIGYRGSGKTTVARILGQRLGWKWKDADEFLEAVHGRTIVRIFAEEGEAGFRSRETAVLEELCRLREHVVATGGGVVLDAANRQRLREAGLAIWLTADIDTLAQRLEQDIAQGARRPALTVGGRAEIEELLKVREPLYRACADLRVETGGRSPLEVAEAIVAWLSQPSDDAASPSRSS